LELTYYGDKLSDNMIETPEGYLICKNAPIGRIGWMNYLAQEVPAVLNIPYGSTVKVYRSPEELFSESAIASFEGKSVTNNHPANLLDINTVSVIERGHLQNVHREGEFLLADLVIKDSGLKAEIKNNIKRELSSGYICRWEMLPDGSVEQKEIVGNHVAVVKDGRAGPRASIKDAKPKNDDERSKNVKGSITKSFLTALGFKHFAQDAEPEQIAQAMDAMNEEEPKEKEPEKEPEKMPVKDEQIPSAQPDGIATLTAKIDQLITAVQGLVQPKDTQPPEFNAQTAMDELEKDLDSPEKKETTDEKPEPEEEKKEPDGEKKPAADAAALKKFVTDMKPVIMAIPDEKTRNEAAKKFVAAVQDARTVRNADGYADILNAVATNKKAAMDQAKLQNQNLEQRAADSAKAWNEQGQKMRGGNN
jgi:hypothetical protein